MQQDFIEAFYRRIYKCYFYINKKNIEVSDFYHEFINKITDKEINKVVVAIIKGDFVGFEENLPRQVRNLHTKYKNEIEIELSDNADLFKFFQENTYNIFEEMANILSEFFTIIYHFIIITNHFVHQRQTFIKTNNEFLYELGEYCNLFILDYSIVDNIEYYEKLSQLKTRVEYKHTEKPFKNLNIFNAKLKFLQYKWLKRQKYNRSVLREFNNLNYSEKYIFNNRIENLDEKIKIGEEHYDIYKKWIDRIEYHYFDKKNEEIDSIIEKEDNISSYNIYLKIKYYKDIIEDISELKKVQRELKKLSNPEKNELYYLNNLFSLLTRSSAKDEIDKEYIKITKKHSDSNNNNFFIHYKYLEYLIRDAKQKININYIEIDFTFFQDILNKCKNNFEWAKRSLNRLYDFDYKDCIIKIQKIEVYHPSAFSLPLSIIENMLIINKLERDLNDLKSLYFQKRNEYYIKKVEDKIKTDEKKSIEIITIFTAIISFIVGSIGAFKFIETFIEALLFIAIFGTSISIFVLLIFASTKGIEKLKSHWYILSFYVAIFIIISCLLLPFYERDLERHTLTIRNRKIIDKKIDSIYQIYDKENKYNSSRIDSLKSIIKKENNRL